MWLGKPVHTHTHTDEYFVIFPANTIVLKTQNLLQKRYQSYLLSHSKNTLALSYPITFSIFINYRSQNLS